MKILDKILYKRLERIREELNSYIKARLPREEKIPFTPMISGLPEEKKKGKIQEKFLSYHRLKDDAFDDSGYQPTIQAQLHQSTIGQSSYTKTESGDTVKIPEFLKKDEKYVNLDKALEKKEESFSTMLLRLIDEKGLKDSDVYKRANIDRRLFSKIRGDEDYVPSKKTAISFCLALQLEMDEAKKLLATAGYALSMSSKFDLIIMYLIENCEYSIHFANIVLDDYGVGTLSK